MNWRLVVTIGGQDQDTSGIEVFMFDTKNDVEEASRLLQYVTEQIHECLRCSSFIEPNQP